MLSRGVKIRLATFVVLAAVGIVYVAGTYLGIVDNILGRGLTVHATFPDSGGLYVGSEVDYRGVKIGKVSRMALTRTGVRVTMSLAPGTKVPLDSPMAVDNLTAVGEQYLDFEPTSTAGPYATNGYTFAGTAADLPESTDSLLIQINSFVTSLNAGDLHTVVHELGTMFSGNAGNLAKMIDAGSRFVRVAQQHEQQTIDLLDAGGAVLHTQELHGGDVTAFAKGLAELTGTLRQSDPQLRTILQGGTAAVTQVDDLMKGLQPTLPLFIGNLVTVNQVLTARLPSLEQTLVTLPLVVSNGFTGTPGDGYGHLNMQFSYTTPPCTDGYLPPPWPSPLDTSDLPLYNAKCTDPRAQPGYSGTDPINQRGVDEAPKVGASTSTPYRVAPYDALTGTASLGNGRSVTVKSSGGMDSLFGSDAWEQLLIGSVAGE